MTEAIIGALLGLSTNVTTSMINEFKKRYEGEQVWECWPDKPLEIMNLFKEKGKMMDFLKEKILYLVY